MSYQNNTTYAFGSSSLDLDNLGVESAKIGDLQVDRDIDVKGDILMNPGRLVDGVDVSALSDTVDEISDALEQVQADVSEMDGKFVDKVSNQDILGRKWFSQLETGGTARLFNVNCDGYVQILGSLNNEFFSNLALWTPFKMQCAAIDTTGKLPNNTLVASKFGGDVEMSKNLDMKAGNIVMAEGKTVDGVDVSVLGGQVTGINGRVGVIEGQIASHTGELTSLDVKVSSHTGELADHEVPIEDLESKDLSHLVTTDTAQVISGAKTFTAPISVKVSNGQVISGVGMRTANRAEQALLSNGDGICDIFMGSDLDGTGLVDANVKWDISSRDKANGRLNFYRGPAYSGTFDEKDEYKVGNYDAVMEFKNTKNNETKRYDCVVTIHKPVNITGELNISGNFLEMKDMKWSGPWPSSSQYKNAKLSLSKIGRAVTLSSPGMAEGVNPAMSGDLAGTYIRSDTAIPVGYRPEFQVQGVGLIYTNGGYLMTRVVVGPSGIVYIQRSMELDPSPPVYFSGDTAFRGFSMTYHSSS